MDPVRIKQRKPFEAGQVRRALINLKKRAQNKKWYSKPATFQQQASEAQYITMLEQKKRGKQCSSGIGEERIKQMEQTKSLLEKQKQKNPCRFGTGAVSNIDK